MLKTLSNTLAATLVAVTTLAASAAFAGDDYYQGASPQQIQNHRIDRTTTQGIGNGSVETVPPSADVGPADGDYYEGISKHR